ncbi:MAG TPA: aspartate-semialdehyde dehydrogenase [Fibrobacteria bacterium]|jgi:aspartate-semialdehyde dehydrogenase|nr:aspartate-semialdehyde dehydrogenase [Fibrobacteria bacterium]
MGIRVAIMGATGAVGQELLVLLKERNFPVSELRLLASARSAGKTMQFDGADVKVQELKHDSFEGIDLVLASAGGSISKEFAPSAVKAGAVVVDNTSYYRMHPDVPLVVPEVNPEAMMNHKGIIANPNCSTIILCLPLWPLHKRYGLKRAVVATYQAASGAGAVAMQELLDETQARLDGEDFNRTVIPHPYAFNLFPHNSPMTDNGYCEEELKMVKETRKIFGDESLSITATCVRVPVLRAHSEAVNVEFNAAPDIAEAYSILGKAPGVEVVEDRSKNRWAMPLDASGKDPVLVGRLRQDISQANTLDFWVVGDQIRKGAALNAIQIAEKLFNTRK